MNCYIAPLTQRQKNARYNVNMLQTAPHTFSSIVHKRLFKLVFRCKLLLGGQRVVVPSGRATHYSPSSITHQVAHITAPTHPTPPTPDNV